jgi:anti-sigma28 factor (negative regulator of flagellin synthesis)
MSIGAAGPVSGPGPVDPREQIRAVEPKETLPPIQDRIEISEAGRLTTEAMQVDPVRTERIEELRRSIEAGLFDAPERLEAALVKFLEQQG